MNEGTKVLTVAAARELDRLATERYGIATICLMENAARSLANCCRKSAVLVVCGPGNNGGDGFAAARHLHNRGARVAIVLSSTAKRSGVILPPDAATNLAIVERMKLPIFAGGATAFQAAVASLGGLSPQTEIIDALFGTGLKRPAAGDDLDLINAINDRPEGCDAIAADIPSGLNADTGEPLGTCVRADATVTFAARKRGMVERTAHDYTGRVYIGDIGVPRELIDELAKAEYGLYGWY